MNCYMKAISGPSNVADKGSFSAGLLLPSGFLYEQSDSSMIVRNDRLFPTKYLPISWDNERPTSSALQEEGTQNATLGKLRLFSCSAMGETLDENSERSAWLAKNRPRNCTSVKILFRVIGIGCCFFQRKFSGSNVPDDALTATGLK